MKKYADRVKVFCELTQDQNSEMDFGLCELLLNNFIETNIFYKSINCLPREDFSINRCIYQDDVLKFCIITPNIDCVVDIMDFMSKNNNIIYGKNKNKYTMFYESCNNEIYIHFVLEEKG